MSEGKWSISTNEEDYCGIFDSEDEAISEGKATEDGSFFVGKCIAPAQPETLFHAYAVENWLEHCVWQHEDYLHDWAEGQVLPSKKQKEELAEKLRPIIAEWLDRHRLRPTFFVIDPDSVKYIENDQQDEEVTE